MAASGVKLGGDNIVTFLIAWFLSLFRSETQTHAVSRVYIRAHRHERSSLNTLMRILPHLVIFDRECLTTTNADSVC